MFVVNLITLTFKESIFTDFPWSDYLGFFKVNGTLKKNHWPYLGCVRVAKDTPLPRNRLVGPFERFSLAPLADDFLLSRARIEQRPPPPTNQFREVFFFIKQTYTSYFKRLLLSNDSVYRIQRTSVVVWDTKWVLSWVLGCRNFGTPHVYHLVIV